MTQRASAHPPESHCFDHVQRTRSTSMPLLIHKHILFQKVALQAFLSLHHSGHRFWEHHPVRVATPWMAKSGLPNVQAEKSCCHTHSMVIFFHRIIHSVLRSLGWRQASCHPHPTPTMAKPILLAVHYLIPSWYKTWPCIALFT